MPSKDFSWEDPSDRTRIGSDAVPVRFALTAPQVVMRLDGRFLLVDPHPAGTWESWMFPYASYVAAAEQVSKRMIDSGVPDLGLTGESTLHDVTRSLRRVRQSFQSEYEAAILDGVKNSLPELSEMSIGSAFYENYSLKFSKSAGAYTAYVFEYFLDRPDYVPTVSIPHVWLLPNELEGFDLSTKLDRRTISSNVLEALPAIKALAAP